MNFNLNKLTKICLLLLATSVFFSCTPRKKLLYLSTGTSSGKATTESAISGYKLQPGDMLYIKILSLDDKTYRLFNSDWKNAQVQNDVGLFIESYTISDSGNVKLPIAGNVALKGLTIQEAQREVQKSIDPYLLDAIVLIKLINFKITVLGEVNRPGTYKIYDNNVDVLEAISLAGDLTAFGNREKIMVLRKSQDNKIEYLDITDINVINSDFFKLKPNDVIYIEPTIAKSLGFKEFPFAIMFSGITTLLVLINFLK